MSVGLEISDYGIALDAIETEIEKIDAEMALMARRKSVLQLAANKILSEVGNVANVYGTGRGGNWYGLRWLG